MTFHRFVLVLLSISLIACASHQSAKSPRDASSSTVPDIKMSQPYRVLMTLRYTVDWMEKAVSANALRVKRQCFRKHYRSRLDWLKCIKEPVMVGNLWRLAVAPLLRNKIDEIYLKIEKKKGGKKELRKMVCGFRKTLPKFKPYTGGKYDEITRWLVKLPVECSKAKPPRPASSRPSASIEK